LHDPDRQENVWLAATKSYRAEYTRFASQFWICSENLWPNCEKYFGKQQCLETSVLFTNFLCRRTKYMPEDQGHCARRTLLTLHSAHQTHTTHSLL
jgi:hypothetical protein